MGEVVKWCVIAIGAAVFVLNLFSLAKRRMTPVLSVAWSIFAVLLLVLGFTLHLSELNALMSPPVALLMIIAMLGVIFTFYYVSTQISELVDKTNELTMQVSLLNSENVRLIRELRQREAAKAAAEDGECEKSSCS